jgi:4-hydroxy-2-oxoheptanedioate aldolase
VTDTQNPLRARIARGDKLLAAWLFSGSTDIAELLARAGYPVVLVCFEHGPGDTADLGDLLRAVRYGGAEPLLRVPSSDPIYLKRVLDGGARSLMVPMIESAEEARAVVAACRYPPLGRRGYAGTVVRASTFGLEEGYAARAHDDLFLALQIESAAGAANAAEIAAVEGVDMIFIGPNDLAGSMGYLERLSETPVLAAVDAVAAAVRAEGKPLGIVPHGGRDAAACAALGYSIVAGAADIGLVREGALADLARFGPAFSPRR